MTKANEPAFPASEGQFNKSESGLSKREYLAGQAMMGHLASMNPGYISPREAQGYAEQWVACADALLAEFEKTDK